MDVVAFNSFGMGVDKATVNTVIHLVVPTSKAAYYQETGRAGRNCQNTFALLLFSIKENERTIYILEREAQSKQNDIIGDVYPHD